MRVLMLENDLLSIGLQKELIFNAGHDVVAVRSGEEALKLLLSEKWDAFVTDLVMPNVNGFQVLNWSDGKLPSKVIVTTALAPADTEELEAKGFKIMRKPYHIDDLLMELVKES